MDNVIVGGGIAGISIALSLLEAGRDFLLLESSNRLGGKIETSSGPGATPPGATLEFGPSSFTDQTDDIFRLLRILDLTGDLVPAAPAARNRYILRDGKITRLPSGPQEILTTKSLTFLGRLRFLWEFFYIPKKREDEESVRDFFCRHFGWEVAEYFADPFVSGIFAGDASRLSLREAFPTMAEAEAKSGSLIRYMMAKRGSAKVSLKSYQLKMGLESIFRRFTEKVGMKKIHLSEKVLDVAPDGGGVRVVTDRGEYKADRFYIASPAYASAAILKGNFQRVSEILSKIDYAPVVTIHLKVPKDEKYPFDGFGVLIPSCEKRGILGALWNSSTFPSLFPDRGHHYITVYAGGARRRELVGEDEAKIRGVVISEVKGIFSLKDDPTIISIRRHSRAIPQYNLGYGKILRGLEEGLLPWPAIRLAGNYLSGISMSKTITHAIGLLYRTS